MFSKRDLKRPPHPQKNNSISLNTPGVVLNIPQKISSGGSQKIFLNISSGGSQKISLNISSGGSQKIFLNILGPTLSVKVLRRE
jgi:N-acetylmuramic acid 6-phosphate (MurNAc-6-P) etherase